MLTANDFNYFDSLASSVNNQFREKKKLIWKIRHASDFSLGWLVLRNITFQEFSIWQGKSTQKQIMFLALQGKWTAYSSFKVSRWESFSQVINIIERNGRGRTEESALEEKQWGHRRTDNLLCLEANKLDNKPDSVPSLMAKSESFIAGATYR